MTVSPPPPYEDPPEYLAALRRFLAPIEGTAYHAGAWYDRTDIGRFHGYVDLLEPHHNGLLHRLVAPTVRRMPDGRPARWVARWVGWEHRVVLRKPGRRS